MKRILMVGAAAALLAACGGKDVRMQAPLGSLVQPGTAPWLKVAGGSDKLDVRGLDHKLTLDPSPDIAAALQSQLGTRLQPDYFPDLVVTCTSLDAALHVDQDKAPGQLSMDLSLHCDVWAQGFDAHHDYKVRVSTGAGNDNAYALALPTLVASGADDIAAQLRGDLHKLNRASR
ncbi:MAG TPA: hypothetical protein VME63_02230 [Dyella sp.]|uniref:hypothetical protein n=1 Tax=Dyella sp. TaxID=1869338 RepID=UPI002CFBD451|nr:hypothetical protein [Dyella sp.]HTV84191.1 hypothetical protein [Dyella sp.]